MSRLTINIDNEWCIDGVGYTLCGEYCNENSCDCEECLIHDAIEKLAHYEDLEDQLEDQLEELYGGRLSLDNVVDNLNRIVQNGEEKLDFARILTNDEAEKWDHWKALEEQGRLISLPCKVGDTVWAIFPTWTPMECEVVAIEILTSTVNIETKVVDTDADRIFWPADFGNTVFLTKEEAEEALKRLQGNE